MRKYKKIIIIVCLIINCINMSACFSYRDINRVLFVTALMIDVDDMGNPVIYAEAYKGVKGTDPEGTDERILFNGKGKTLFEAIRDMNSTSSFKLNYTQNKVVIFTQKAAEFGLENFIDLLARDQELIVRPYIAIYPGNPEELMKLQITQEKYIGFFITELIQNIGSSPRAVVLTLNDFYNERVSGDKTCVITMVDIPKNSLEPKLQINGGAVIQRDKMVTTLESSDGLGYNFLNDSLSSGILEVTNPLDINKFVTLEIEDSKTKTEISYSDNMVHLKKKIKVKVYFAEAQKSIVLTNETIRKMEAVAEDNIEKACQLLFEKFKSMKIDIFQIKEKFYQKYPKIEIQDIISKTELKVEVDVEIKTAGDDKNFK
ncbi:Ger(x)C family spore germination protein [Clostridium lacusfryxellense]|uniref:Ger(x)C family spore germination protein n=1 Tax=Clostridium lacusfryxellense TaxID=205328 RepID=UPI001C0E3972|nr:Ger(x)C family spore germination protein [Clostridium lacusfryxellense]MBU3113621.1 Ger(x)C family spore germination protein [Clostridium lacusfryxellense]